jgi:hypothetical protein
LPVGGGALAFCAEDLRPGPDVLLVGAGTAVWVDDLAGRGDQDMHRGSFARLAIGLPAIRRGLSDYTEAELSTAFLAGGAMEWRRARGGSGARDPLRRIAIEAWRRSLLLPSVVLAMGFATVLLSWPGAATSRPVLALGVPVLVLCAAGLPRLLGGLAAGAAGG